MREKIQEFIAKVERRTWIIIGSVALGIIIFACIIAFALNTRSSSYTTLFSKTSKEDSNQIIHLLTENNIPYKYVNDGDILVKKGEKDKAMALVAMQAYPTSGFAYEITGKAGSMATDSDKQRYAIYDLQNRLAATIRMFKGVQDAKVTIAVGEQNKYVLSDQDNIPASASVFVKMRDGGAPSTDQVLAIQRLLSRSIRGVSMDNVAVIDGNGVDVSVVVPDDEAGKGAGASGNAVAENAAQLQSDIAGIIEKHIVNNVKSVFNPIYGIGNVSVVARADINVESVMREAISYSVPNDIDKKDKRGLIVRESGQGGGSLYPPGAEGVVGTEVNSDVTEYKGQKGKGKPTDAQSYQYAKEYLVNQVKEQGTIPAGAVKDVSLSISINSENSDIPRNELIDLAGNAAGIPKQDRAARITIVYGKFNNSNQNTGLADNTNSGTNSFVSSIPAWLYSIIGAILVIIIGAIVLWYRRRQQLLLALQLEAINAEDNHVHIEGLPPIEENERIEENEERLFMQNDRGMGLRKDVRDFADKNPEIAARLLKTWLTGGEEDA